MKVLAMTGAKIREELPLARKAILLLGGSWRQNDETRVITPAVGSNSSVWPAR
jgi:hypothetical protein